MKFPIPDDWDGETWCNWSVCWPSSEHWEGLLRGFLTLAQRGYTWDERTGSILDVQQIGQEITARNIDLRSCLMSCDSPELGAIADAIQALADAVAGLTTSTGNEAVANAIHHLAEAQCCDNLQIDVHGGVQGVVDPPTGETVPIYGSVPPIGMPSGEFPPEYPDEESYLLDKCRVANAIVDGWISTLRAFSTITAAQLAIGVAVFTVFIASSLVFPPALFPALIAAIAILGTGTTVLFGLADYISDHREEVICMLVTSDTGETIISLYADFIDVAIAALDLTGPIGAAVKSIALLLVNSDTLNQLFEFGAAAAYPDADCASCEECADVIFDFSTGVGGWEAVSAFPSCFGLASPGLGTVSESGGILTLTGVSSGSTIAGGMKVTGLDIPLIPGMLLANTMRHSVATSGVYIDAVIITDTDCNWRTMSNNFESTVFVGLGLTLDDIEGSTIQEIWIYVNKAAAGTECVVDFDQIGVFCPP